MISKDNNDLSSYSVPEESAKCLWNGILSHPGHTNLPVECRENFDRIKFVGKRLPTMAISWRFAESGAALKGFEASLLNVLLNRKYGIDPPEITIDPDHAQLFLMSFFLVEVDPKGPNAPLGSTPPSIVSVPQGGPHIYRTKDDRFYHLHPSLNPDPALRALGLPWDMPEFTTVEDSWPPFVEKMSRKSAAEWDTILADQYKQAGTIIGC